MEGLSLHPKGAAALLHRKGESPLRLNTKRGLMPRMEGSHCNRRELRLCCTGRESPPCDDVSGVEPPLQSKGAVALLHREGEPRPPLSTQRNSNDRRRAHTATEGSHGSAAPGGEAPLNAE
ncbi:hypothetical protein ROHU_021082 [Labeo rohita]|uniref:Uncharacterized protein n=1 Tax=Labeo rohita TaxID=84645 RepID=A0A498MW84_LABRO|nr:hypothetical protein ROHU_021082 [Labeo rohita]